jgi:5-methylcytosine-specific restriction endonuclease McrBC GTP-binding regulatory subunit McrB
MRPIEINSVVETYNDRVVVKDYITRNYDDGTKVQNVVINSYAVTLYGNNGQLQDYTSKGNVVDKMI